MATAKYIEKIEVIRKERKMSIKTMCEKAGIDASYYSRMKSGQVSNTTMSKIDAIATALECTVEFIMDGSSEKKSK